MHLPHLPEKRAEKLFSPAESETHDPKIKSIANVEPKTQNSNEIEQNSKNTNKYK